MLRRFSALVAALFVAACAPAALAQTVRLTLVDHIVGSELLHNAPLPSGTKVWVVARNDPRAVRLRSGYGEVLGSLPGATQDELGAGGTTRKGYAATARSGRALFVLAQLPDGRLFQSYVKTSDAGWQPGFDAIREGRVSMGRVPSGAAARLTAALAPAAPAAAPRPDTAARVARTDSLGAQDSLAARDTLLADTVRTATGVEPVEAVPPSAVPVEEEPAAPGTARRPWAWPLAGGLLVGALAGGGLMAARYERMLKRQREHLTRLMPAAPNAAQESAERAERVRQAQEAEQQRSERVFQQIELLQEALKARDAEIARLRRTQD